MTEDLSGQQVYLHPKPLLEQGAGRMSTVNIYITVNNIADVQLITDPAIILATITEVDKAKGERITPTKL